MTQTRITITRKPRPAPRPTGAPDIYVSPSGKTQRI